jgi:hypothetical protein
VTDSLRALMVLAEKSSLVAKEGTYAVRAETEALTRPQRMQCTTRSPRLQSPASALAAYTTGAWYPGPPL